MKNNSKEVVFEFHLPGFKKENIKIKLTKNSIAIKAEKKLEKGIQKKDFFHKEKTNENFNYSTTLPEINPKKAKIEFKKGILKITIPKR